MNQQWIKQSNLTNCFSYSWSSCHYSTNSLAKFKKVQHNCAYKVFSGLHRLEETKDTWHLKQFLAQFYSILTKICSIQMAISCRKMNGLLHSPYSLNRTGFYSNQLCVLFTKKKSDDQFPKQKNGRSVLPWRNGKRKRLKWTGFMKSCRWQVSILVWGRFGIFICAFSIIPNTNCVMAASWAQITIAHNCIEFIFSQGAWNTCRVRPHIQGMYNILACQLC